MATRNDQDWQLTKKTVLERNKFMLNNNLMSDIQFCCGKGKKKFHAHKYVLATTSNVFFTMFYGGIPETNTEIHLSDTDEESFGKFLCFVYTDDCQLTPDNAVKVMYLAKKYMVPSLTEKCIEKLRRGIEADNVAIILEQTLHFEKKVADQCWEVVDLETNDVITSKGFSEISQETLISLLKRESLNVSEVELFQAVLKWCEKKCFKKGLEATGKNKRLVLGDGVYLISFFSMTQQEFTQYVVTSALLRSEEIVPIYAKFNGSNVPALKWQPPTRKERSSKLREKSRESSREGLSKMKERPTIIKEVISTPKNSSSVVRRLVLAIMLCWVGFIAMRVVIFFIRNE